MGVPYLGIGPSAHSFDGKKRGYNIANNVIYIKSIREGKLPYRVDNLSGEDLVNEYIMTSLRTMWGCSLDKLKMDFGVVLDGEELKKLKGLDLIINHGNAIKLTDKGKLLADTVAASLFIGL
jgi:oxygen-independent coproporphyrinogen-3 oxidase